MEQSNKIAVIGGGSWATALAKVIVDKVGHINWFIYEEEIIENIKKHYHNPLYLSSIEFDPNKITFYNRAKTAIEDSNIVVFVVPSAFVKNTLQNDDIDFQGRYFVNATKGIVPGDNLTVTQYFQNRFKIPGDHLAVISGPSHAEEIAMERLTYLTVAAENNSDAELIQDIISNGYVKTIISNDIHGIEYGAVLKNIYALGVGISHGLGYGDNFTAVFVANALREMNRFLNKVFKNERSLYHSVYLGDLLVTAYSQFSRNRTFGTMIGKGYSVKSAMLEMNMVAEGYFATKCIHEINESYNVKMPIASAIYNILYEKISPTIEYRLLSEKLK
jgi:glycerol-3-phosphate dehydrogenase (NAD(P)+)